MFWSMQYDFLSEGSVKQKYEKTHVSNAANTPMITAKKDGLSLMVLSACTGGKTSVSVETML